MNPGSSGIKKIALLIVAAAMSGVITVLVLISRPSPAVLAKIGMKIPDMERRMMSLDGEETTFGQLQGHPVIVNFWASWCRPCRREFPLFVDVLADHREWRILGVIYDDSASQAREFAEKLGATWPSVTDSDGKIAAMFGVSTPPGIPQTFFIDRRGILRSRIFGEINEERLNIELKRVEARAS